MSSLEIASKDIEEMCHNAISNIKCQRQKDLQKEVNKLFKRRFFKPKNEQDALKKLGKGRDNIFSTYHMVTHVKYGLDEMNIKKVLNSCKMSRTIQLDINDANIIHRWVYDHNRLS